MNDQPPTWSSLQCPRLTDLSIDQSFKACLVVSIKAHEADLVEDYIAISGLKILFLISLYLEGQHHHFRRHQHNREHPQLALSSSQFMPIDP